MTNDNFFKKNKKTDQKAKNNFSSVFDKIPSKNRSLRLITAGLKTGIKAASTATLLATGKKTKKQYSQEILKTTAVNFVKELEHLKGGMMKAGQLLSVYGEHFLPPEVNQILKKLQSSSKPVSFSVMQKKINRVFKEYKDDITIDPNSIGAASLGQVYKAKTSKKLIDMGFPKYLAIKVQYPMVAKSVDSDLELLKRLITVAKLIPDIERFDAIYEEIKSMLKKEVDYNKEAQNYQFAAELLKDHSVFVVPKIYDKFCTSTVLTMEYMQGIRLDDSKVSKLSQKRKNRLAYHFTDLLFKEIFVWQNVQTDPHIGNFLISLAKAKNKGEDIYQDKIVLLDYGAVRKFPNSYIANFKKLALASINSNRQDIINSGMKLGFLKKDDTDKMCDLFCQILTKATYPFSNEFDYPCNEDGSYCENDYDWTDQSLVKELSNLARNAVFSFKLRPPPKEAIFLDRKLVSSVTLLKILNAKMSPRRLALKYLKQPKNLDN